MSISPGEDSPIRRVTLWTGKAAAMRNKPAIKEKWPRNQGWERGVIVIGKEIQKQQRTRTLL
jgi:hypothetical protein